MRGAFSHENPCRATRELIRRHQCYDDEVTSYRRSAVPTCPRCGHKDDPESFYHSSDGLVCERCHRLEKSADRERMLEQEGSVDAMLNGLLAPTCGLGCFMFAFLAEGPMPPRALMLFAFGLSAVGVCIVRAFRFPREGQARRPLATSSNC